jgi:hypothetical protein
MLPGLLQDGPALFRHSMPMNANQEIRMKIVCERATLPLTVMVLLAGLAGLSACANVPYISGETQGIKEKADLQTGSNLVRRNNGNADLRQVDKDSLESSMRSTNANRDNGK